MVIHIVFFTLDSTPPADNSEVADDQGRRRHVAEQDNKSQNIKEEEDRSQKIKEKEDRLQKRRDVLLLLSVLGTTLAYQAGLTPPGGFWEDDNKSGHRAGFPVLQDKYPLRYKIFYYCNAASFMASVALIVLLMKP